MYKLVKLLKVGVRWKKNVFYFYLWVVIKWDILVDLKCMIYIKFKFSYIVNLNVLF